MFNLQNLEFDWDFAFSDTEIKKIEEVLTERKDYCYSCGTDELYAHVMTFKCSKCHSIILGGTNEK